jgi:hypothetical protein
MNHSTSLNVAFGFVWFCAMGMDKPWSIGVEVAELHAHHGVPK